MFTTETISRLRPARAGGPLQAIGLALALVLAPAAAFSAGSDSSEPPEKTKTTTECDDGQIYDKNAGECVDAEQSSLDDDGIYKAARELAYDGQYENAIAVLKTARDQNDPRILNYLGYANRKAGRMDLGMAYYRKALARDPDYSLARSYMGQALLEQGNIKGAMAELAAIRKSGDSDTWAYRALAKSFGGDTAYN